jgi:hypothetical protein
MVFGKQCPAFLKQPVINLHRAARSCWQIGLRGRLVL